MSGPLIFISRSKVKPGKREQYEEHLRVATEIVDSEEPRMIGFNSYLAEDGWDTSTVQIHPDEESVDTHLKIFFERIAERAFDALETYEIDIYGSPSEATLEAMSQVPGATVRVLPVHLRGFLRPQPL
jgi:quinol monooxygenase YgiN